MAVKERRIIPHRDLPSPEVPPAVRIVRNFVNTTDFETGTDDISTPEALGDYVVASGLGERRYLATADDLALAVLLRRGLRRALELNHEGTADPVAELDEALAQLPFTFRWGGDVPRLEPARSGIAGALSRIVMAMQDAIVADQWWRLKICLSDECEWAFYDKSKNRSARWCEYGCGDRIRMRAYRARRASEASTAMSAERVQAR